MSQVSLISLPQIAYKGIPVVSTESLAKAYEVEEYQIRQNFKNNKERFVEGKHLFSLSGNELKEFKRNVENFYSVPKNVNALTLWTERGAARHAKMLNSDKAWDVFELLEETFFAVAKAANVKSEQAGPDTPIGPADQNILLTIVRAKVAQMPEASRRGIYPRIWSRFNNHFRIARYSQLPQAKMSEAIAYLMKLEFGKKVAVEMPDAVDMVEAIPDFDMSKLPRGFEQMLEKADEAQALLKNIEHLMNFTTPCCYNSAIGEEKMLFVRNAKDCIQIARTNLKSCEYALRSFARIRSRIKFLYDGPARTA